jgi:hypothetical protein
MASKEYEKSKGEKPEKSNLPKNQQLLRMLSFRVVPSYFKEIEKVADKKKMTVSKLIRSYIKEGLKRDHELNSKEDKEFRVE